MSNMPPHFNQLYNQHNPDQPPPAPLHQSYAPHGGPQYQIPNGYQQPQPLPHAQQQNHLHTSYTYNQPRYIPPQIDFYSRNDVLAGGQQQQQQQQQHYPSPQPQQPQQPPQPQTYIPYSNLEASNYRSVAPAARSSLGQQVADLYIDTPPAGRLQSNASQAPSVGSNQSHPYGFSPTAAPPQPNLDINNQLQSLSLSNGQTSGYNPASYTFNQSPPPQSQLGVVQSPPSISPSSYNLHSPAPMLMDPSTKLNSNSLSGSSYNPADYAPQVVNAQTMSNAGAFYAPNGYTGAYGPSQSYAIGNSIPETTPARGNSQDYGGLQSLYMPSIPPPLPNDLSSDIQAGLDDLAEMEWEKEEREWLREQERIARSHPLPRIPSNSDNQENGWTQETHGNDSIPLPYQKNESEAAPTVHANYYPEQYNDFQADMGGFLLMPPNPSAHFQPNDDERVNRMPNGTVHPYNDVQNSTNNYDNSTETYLLPPIGRRTSFEIGDDASRGRPLPAIPPSSSNSRNPSSQRPTSTVDYDNNFPRSASLLYHTTSPGNVAVPARSKTDAGEHHSGVFTTPSRYSDMNPSIFGSDAIPSPVQTNHFRSSLMVDLPALPPISRRFVPSKLGTAHFDKCLEPWSYSHLVGWLKKVTAGEQDLRKQLVVQGLVHLFTHKVPTMNTAEAETLADSVVHNLIRVGVIELEEEWVRFSAGVFNGVIIQLTGGGCYGPRAHTEGSMAAGIVGVGDSYILTGRCYSKACQRTLKKINISIRADGGSDWSEFYRVPKSAYENAPKKELKRQYVLHEIIQKEEGYKRQLDVLVDLYRDKIKSSPAGAFEAHMLDRFIDTVFGRLEAVRTVNAEVLLPQLRYRQLEQGPWLVGVSDIFREWIRKARGAYVAYAAAFPNAEMTFRREIEANEWLKGCVEDARQNERCSKLDWSTFLKAPISTLAHYGLLLKSLLDVSPPSTAETDLLQSTLIEVRAVIQECDDKVDEMTQKIQLIDLKNLLKLRSHMSTDLKLSDPGRRILHQGTLFRPKANRLGWIESYAFLFDHCMVISKSSREGYDVSRLPIPIDLLVIDDITGGTGSSTATTGGAAEDPDKFPFRIQHLGHDTYTLSANTAAIRDEWCNRIARARADHAQALRAQNVEPFQLRVLADTSFALDPSGSAAAGTASSRPVVVPGSPLDLALSEAKSMFPGPRPGSLSRSRVNCSIGFMYSEKPYIVIGTDAGIYVSEATNARGWARAVIASKVTQLGVISQFNLLIALVDKSVVAYSLEATLSPLLTGTALPTKQRLLPQKLSVGRGDVGFFAVARMKGRLLLFYKKRENLSSVFKVIEPISSLERPTGSSAPVSSWTSLFKRSSAEAFREFDRFYIPTECTNLSLFNSTVAVTTSRGFEVLTLDKKQVMTIPNLNDSYSKTDGIAVPVGGQNGTNATSAPQGAAATAAAAVTSLTASIAARLQNQTPLNMFRISDQEFLICYASKAIYVDKYGDVSRSLVVDFVCKAKSIAVHGGYLILFDSSFVEIRSIADGRLRQVIVGRDIRCLDDGRGLLSSVGPDEDPRPVRTNSYHNGARAAGSSSVGWSDERMRAIKFSMRHPEHDRMQLILELLLG